MKHAVFRMAAVLIGLAAAVTLTEAGLRLAGFEFHLYPSRVQFGWPDPVTIQRAYESDPDLLWVPKGYGRRVESLAGSRPDLVLMGCSCTQFGRYDRFLGERVVEEHPGTSVTFLNLGVGGWSTYQGLRQMERDVARIRPRMVTIFYGWNDHWRTFGIPDREIAGFNLEYPRWLTWLSERSRTAQVLNRLVFTLRFRERTSQRRVSPEEFRANLGEMVRIAREHGMRPILLTAPSSHRPGQEPPELAERWLEDLSELVPLHETYVRQVRTVAAEEGVDLVDLYALFHELPEQERVASFKADGIHPTEAGDRRIAHFLYEYLERAGLIRELVSPSRPPPQGER